MTHELWHRRWAENQIGFHREEVNPWLSRYGFLLERSVGRRALVSLCGKTLDLLHLRSLGFEVFGVELSPIAVQAFFRENNIAPTVTTRGRFQAHSGDGITILVGDVFDLTTTDLGGEVDVIYDRAALIALPMLERARYAPHIVSVLRDRGRILLVSARYQSGVVDGPPYSVELDEVHRIFRGCSIDRLGTLETLPKSSPFRDRGLTWLEEHAWLMERFA